MTVEKSTTVCEAYHPLCKMIHVYQNMGSSLIYVEFTKGDAAGILEDGHDMPDLLTCRPMLRFFIAVVLHTLALVRVAEVDSELAGVLEEAMVVGRGELDPTTIREAGEVLAMGSDEELLDTVLIWVVGLGVEVAVGVLLVVELLVVVEVVVAAFVVDTVSVKHFYKPMNINSAPCLPSRDQSLLTLNRSH